MGGDSGGGGGGGGQPAQTTTIQKAELPAYVQPYAEQLMQRGATLSNQPYTPYTGQRIAGMTAQNMAGLNAIQNRSIYGSPEENAARDQFTNTLSGAYMSPDSNPYLKANVDAAMGQAASRVNSQFSGSNYGTTANQEVLARTLGETAGQMYGQNYSNERDQQARMASLLPQYQGIDYNNAQQLLGVGDIYRQENQNALNQSYGDFLQQQQYPFQQLDVLSNSIKGATGGGGTTTTSAPNPYQVNKTANAVGGALAGGSLAGMFGSQYAPYGAAGGGLLGLWG